MHEIRQQQEYERVKHERFRVQQEKERLELERLKLEREKMEFLQLERERILKEREEIARRRRMVEQEQRKREYVAPTPPTKRSNDRFDSHRSDGHSRSPPDHFHGPNRRDNSFVHSTSSSKPFVDSSRYTHSTLVCCLQSLTFVLFSQKDLSRATLAILIHTSEASLILLNLTNIVQWTPTADMPTAATIVMTEKNFDGNRGNVALKTRGVTTDMLIRTMETG